MKNVAMDHGAFPEEISPKGSAYCIAEHIRVIRQVSGGARK
jgi:hypothetical protein